MRSLVVIPALNEEATLPRVLAELAAHAPDVDVLVVDDGSTDRTTEVARAGGALVARLPINLGIGGALRTGFRYALREGYDRVAQLDADGQHDSRELRALFNALDGGADLVIGSRFAGGTEVYRIGRVRTGAMRFLRVAVALLAGSRLTDTTSGLRAFSRPMVASFAREYSPEYLESVEALAAALRGGFAVVEVPVAMRAREAGVASTRNWRLAYHYLRLSLVLLLTARRRPTRP